MPSFLSPFFLIGALAAAVPIVLHLLKREPEPRVRFPAVKLLKQAPVEYTEKRRLRELLLLALRVTALVLLAVAFAQPFFPAGAALASSGATVVALDTSYSLSAPGVFNRAKQLARSAVDRAASGDAVGVVTFDDVATIAARPALDRAIARAAIDAASVGFGATRYAGALGAAVQALEGRRGTIVVVTDLQETGWDAAGRASVPESVRIEIADVGPLSANLAVVALQAGGEGITATVRNAGDRPRDARVRLTLDGRAAGDATVSVGSHASADVDFANALKGATPSSAAVTVDDRDGIAADDVRYALLDAASRPSVLVVTSTGDVARDAFYVQQALAAGASLGQGLRLTAVSAAQLSTMDAATLASQAAVLLLSTRGLERRGREAIAGYVHAGGGLMLAAGPDIDGAIAGDVLGSDAPLRVAASPDDRPAGRAPVPQRSLTATDVRHPVFQSFGSGGASLGLVRFRTIAVVDGGACQTVGRFTTGEAALLDCAAGQGRALIFASDLDDRWNDFPLHATFVPFVHESVRYLSGRRSSSGTYTIADTPAGVPPAPGIAVLAASSGAPPKRIAVNVDPQESDPSRMSADEFQAAVSRLKDVGATRARLEARQQEDRQHLWTYVLGLMVAVIAVEGMIASRTA